MPYILKNKCGELDLLNTKSLKLLNITGLSDLENNINSTKHVNQDGETFNSSSLGVRDIFIKLKITSCNFNEVERIKEELLRFFTPKSSGEFFVGKLSNERIIKYEVSRIPKFVPVDYRTLECFIEIIALDPYWLGRFEIGEQISTWIGGMSWKFSLPFKMRQKGPTKKNIINEGHVDTPIQVFFKGPAVNPSIINHATGEFIKVNRELTSDDTLIISTEFGNKTVEIERDGVKTNAFHYIDVDSTFFSLQVGDNLLEYTTDSLEPQSVEIRYRNRYLGI